MSIWTRINTQLSKSLSAILVLLVRFYQASLSPLLSGHCRYSPTCSEYFIQSVRQRGPLVGALAGLWRICRCHPFAKGGYDPVVSCRCEHFASLCVNSAKQSQTLASRRLPQSPAAPSQ